MTTRLELPDALMTCFNTLAELLNKTPETLMIEMIAEHTNETEAKESI
ncbi:MAG: hypothetical protein WBC07_03495 [Methylotenera sp.]